MKTLLLITGLLTCISTSLLGATEPVSNVDKKSFRFFINADPQMGPENTERKGLKILNELLENFVAEVNAENKKEAVDFVVYNGDLVWDPYQDAFDNFTRIVSKQEVPVKLVHGNHDGYNDDPKFFQAQKKLSGYEKLNYSFSYGDWQFIVIGAQEKYLQKEQKEQQLAWIRKELAAHKDKQVMLFMHYHIMPVGLSQMEYYTYWPMKFKNQMLEAITEHGNVKYAFTGHVHVGVKASIKSSLEYKGTKFVNSPTPVMARPFGEEFVEFEHDPDDRYFRRGFYLEVKVDGDDVEMIGHKIDHDFEVNYPAKLKAFKPAMDRRFFKSEAEITPNKNLRNPSFKKGFNGWKKSYRYKKDTNNAFKNIVKNGSNILSLKAPWGSWSFDEYMETYQVVELDLSQPVQLQYEFKTPKFHQKGGGGYIKLILYNKNKARDKMVLFHWGGGEERVKLMYQSWFYNSDGNRASTKYLDKNIKNKKIISFNLEFDQRENQLLDVDLNRLFSLYDSAEFVDEGITHFSISHGVWSRVTRAGKPFFSELVVKNIALENKSSNKVDAAVVLNNKVISADQLDSGNPYFQF